MPGMLRRAMVYLGLVDDDYDEYDAYDEQQSPQRAGRAYAPEPAHDPNAAAVRPLPREAPVQEAITSVSPVTPRPSVVRPITPVQSAKVHVVAPAGFADAQEIGDRVKASQPVIVNLQAANRELSRRMIDFCSGATYVLGGSMDKVADQVFLLTPSNVEVSAEEKRRLQERGLYKS
ncbi:MAG TPA: cell division protein SepF [Acidimicrobiales bacterium]|jgi:cell division inhibitor SepF|nr:cell division protein SepF [Acidimicrobiales bacterium]